MAVMTRGRRTIHLVELGQTIPAGRRGGLGLGGSLVSASVGAMLGILIIVLKAGLH